MSNLVIVAIPDENDRVWKVSSEQVPHLTLLFLGDSSEVKNLDMITQFVEHASSMLNPFYLPVDRRGELGNDPETGPADVLFFKKGRYDFKAVYDFRAQLLQDNNIKTAYDAAQQFDGPWTPHLTLGYKDSPAKPQDANNDYPFYDVSFNTIAVWPGNYDGPSFLLKSVWDEWDTLETMPMDVAMSALAPDALVGTADLGAQFLEHHGVKGMRWGERKAKTAADVQGSAARASFRPTHKLLPHIQGKGAKTALLLTGAGAAASPKMRAQLKEADRQIKIEKLDTKWRHQFTLNKKFADVHNSTANEMDKFLVGHNAKYKDFDFSKRGNEAQHKKYEDEYLKEFEKQYGIAAEKVYGTSPSGKSKVTYDHDSGLLRLTTNAKLDRSRPNKVKHAAMDDAPEDTQILLFLTETDAEDKIVKTWPLTPADDVSDDPAAHTALGAEFIEHYGVKGMHWGRRKEEPTAVAPTAMSKVPHGDKRKTTIKVEGGENHPAHEDAIKVAESKAKLKKSGVAALSNKELQDVQTRLNLERNVTQLAGPSTSTAKGAKFVKGLVGLNKQVNDATGTALNTHRLYKQLA